MAPNGVAFIQTHQSWHCMTLAGISGVSPSEIWVIELLRAIAERERAEQGRHCIAADPMAPRHVIDNLSPSELSSCISIVSEALIWSHCGSFDASTRDDATPPILAAGQVQGVTAGTSHGAGISTVPKLAGPATSKYSMPSNSRTNNELCRDVDERNRRPRPRSAGLHT
jgi:hypothetical protein